MNQYQCRFTDENGKDVRVGGFFTDYAEAKDYADILRSLDYRGVRVMARQVTEWWDTGA